MADGSFVEGENEHILYDLLVITEWPPETDTQVSHIQLFFKFSPLIVPQFEYYLDKNIQKVKK